MKKWRNLGIAIALGAALVGGMPVISQAANDGTQSNGTGGFGAAMGRTGSAMIDTISTFIGRTSDEVRTERQSGKSLADIAAEKGVAKEKLLDQMVQQRKAQLDALVKEGKLNQEQADQYLDQMKNRMGTMIERTETGKPDFAQGRGQGKGRGGMQGGNCGVALEN